MMALWRNGITALPWRYLSKENDERPSQIGRRENLHDAAQAIQGAHNSEHLLWDTRLLLGDGVPVPLHREDVRKAERDVCPGRIKNATPTWEGRGGYVPRGNKLSGVGKRLSARYWDI